MEENKTYKVKVICGNCGFSGKAEIEKQVPVERHRCSSCGCMNLKRQQESEVNVLR